jgi:cell division protein FtsB
VEKVLDLEKKIQDLTKANESHELIIKNLRNHNYKLKNQFGVPEEEAKKLQIDNDRMTEQIHELKKKLEHITLERNNFEARLD